MKSLKVKLLSCFAVVCLSIALLIVGIWAAGTQSINLRGEVDFNINDPSLYVKDIRIKNGMEEADSRGETIVNFVPGFVNTSINLNLGQIENSTGGLSIYIDIINTTDTAYVASATADISGANITASGTISGDAISQNNILTTNMLSGTIEIMIEAPNLDTIDLDQILIMLNEFTPQVYDYFTFEENGEGTVELTAVDLESAPSTDIVIPATVSQNESGQWVDGNDYKVTAIASANSSTDGVFYNSVITSIELPSTLKTIGNYAFYDCEELTSITFPLHLNSIGSSAFSSCGGLTGIILPSSLNSIGSSAFSSCNNINVVEFKGTLLDWLSISMPSNTWISADHKFIINGEELIDLVIPEGVVSLAMGLFSYCNEIKSVSFPSTIVSIGSYVFQHCDGLTRITLPSSIISIGNHAFSNCSGLTSISLPSSLISIGIYAFNNCRGLTSITLPSSVTSIGNCAFQYCSGLTSITLPFNLTSIEDGLFTGCSGLTSIDLSKCTNLTSIGERAFYGCTGLTEVDLSDCTNLSSIGRYAFQNCTNLTSIPFPNVAYWYRTTSSTATSGTNMIMSDSTQNATWLTETYYNYYFKHNA